ncbi:MAG: hypothetical protein KAT77_03380 [Nanoarchaeota archaeon]|nr:hypothetical protein [Nanoarchaeota archaeon]
MDVEKIQKINELTLKLQEQGGLSRDEALKQAEQMLSKDENLEVNEISSQKVEEIDNKTPNSDITWQNAMEKNTKFIVKEFKDIQREIINLKSEITNLNHKIKNLNLAPPIPPPEAKETQASLNESEKGLENSKNSQRELPKEKHPKQGDCKPEDFAVEKMFYCGNK